LFTRRTCLTVGNGIFGVDWAGIICAKVKEITGQEIELWERVFSPGFGIVLWTGWFEDLVSLEARPLGKLSDAGVELTVGGASMTDAASPSTAHPPGGAGQYVGGAVAETAQGNIERAMTTGVEIGQKAEATTWLSTLFLQMVTGPGGAVGWPTGYEIVTQLERVDGRPELVEAHRSRRITDFSGAP